MCLGRGNPPGVNTCFDIDAMNGMVGQYPSGEMGYGETPRGWCSPAPLYNTYPPSPSRVLHNVFTRNIYYHSSAVQIQWGKGMGKGEGNQNTIRVFPPFLHCMALPPLHMLNRRACSAPPRARGVSGNAQENSPRAQAREYVGDAVPGTPPPWPDLHLPSPTPWVEDPPPAASQVHPLVAGVRGRVNPWEKAVATPLSTLTPATMEVASPDAAFMVAEARVGMVGSGQGEKRDEIAGKAGCNCYFVSLQPGPCWACGSRGHKARQCPKQKEEAEQAAEQRYGSALIPQEGTPQDQKNEREGHQVVAEPATPSPRRGLCRAKPNFWCPDPKNLSLWEIGREG